MRIRKIDYSELTDYNKIFEIVFADLGIDRADIGEEEIGKIVNVIKELEHEVVTCLCKCFKEHCSVL